MTKEINIVAEVLLKDGYKESLMPMFKELVSGSRAEAGNIMYDMTEHLDNPNHLFIIETWASEAAIAIHNESEHFQNFVNAINGKTDRLVISKLNKIL